MHEFTDTAGRRWRITVTLAEIRRVRDVTGVDLLALFDNPEKLIALARDVFTFVDVLFVIVRPQAEEAQVTEEAFCGAIDGTVTESATSAFLEALVDYFPGERRRALREVLDKSAEITNESERMLARAIDDGTIDREIERALEPLRKEFANALGRDKELPAPVTIESTAPQPGV